jgi:hypothetical protein
MVHNLLFYGFLLLGILGLYILLRWVWLRGHTTAKPITQCSKEPQPFPGLTHKPSCALCEDGAQTSATAPLAAPLPIVSTRGCPRTVTTQHQFCPVRAASEAGNRRVKRNTCAHRQGTWTSQTPVSQTAEAKTSPVMTWWWPLTGTLDLSAAYRDTTTCHRQPEAAGRRQAGNVRRSGLHAYL